MEVRADRSTIEPTVQRSMLQDLAVHRLWAYLWNWVRRRSLMNWVGLNIMAGPCRVLDPNGPKYHPESWTSNANIFFVDQPIGVGYSYADHGESVVRLEISLLCDIVFA